MKKDASHRRESPPRGEVCERCQDRHRHRKARTGGARARGSLRPIARASRKGTEGGRRSAPARSRRNEEALGRLMVLVDTSVWIRFLSNRPPYARDLDELLSRGDVSGHDFVLGELLIGDKGARKQLLADYVVIHHVPMVPHSDVVEFARQRRLHGRGIGWIDAHLLASSLVGRVSLWTADPRLAAVASELGINYQ